MLPGSAGAMLLATLLRSCWRIGMGCARLSYASFVGSKSICVMAGFM
jgi:hypothetical protein